MVSVWEKKLAGGQRSSSLSSSGFRGVRVSKFRHVYGTGSRKENCYEGIRISRSTHDSQFCCINPKFVAVILEVAGGGAFQIVPVSWTGRVDPHFGRVSGHSGPITEIKWNPFNDNVIASASDDCTVKLWHVPDNGIKVCINEWLAELAGHSRKVAYIDWHPTAENIMASAALDNRLCLWDISTCQSLVSCEVHTDAIQSMTFNRIGNLIATTARDKRLRVIDPRTGDVSAETLGHEGSKCSKVTFLKDSTQLFTTGCSRTSSRQLALWDTRKFDSPLFLQELDYSSGVLCPFFDSDTGIMYVGGKGDGNIRYYEITSSAPFVHYISDYTSSSPQRGLAVMPKRGLKFNQCEIFRFYKLHTTSLLVEPISFTVPRKSGLFQSDLYPPTPGPTPALQANEWFCGLDKEPVLLYPQKGTPVAVTNKPVSVKRSPGGKQSLIVTADKNNERKFQFLSEVTRADYRDITQRDDYPDIVKEQQLRHRLKEEQTSPQHRRRLSLTSPSSSEDMEGHHCDEEQLHGDSSVEHSHSTDEGTTDGGPPAKSTRYPPLLKNGFSVGSEEFLGDRFSRQYTVSPRAYDSSPATPGDPKEDKSDVFITPPEDPSVNNENEAVPCQKHHHGKVKHSTSVPTPKREGPKRISSEDQTASKSVSPRSSQLTTSTTMTSSFATAAHAFRPSLPGKSYSFIAPSSFSSFFSTKPGRIISGPVFQSPHRRRTSSKSGKKTGIQSLGASRSSGGEEGATGERVSSPSSLPDEPISGGISPRSPSSTSSKYGHGGGVGSSISAPESPSKRELELQKLYTAQCKNIRLLMDEKEEHKKQIGKLEAEVVNLKAKCEKLERAVGLRDEEVECLRHEIAWKDSRIEELQNQIYRLLEEGTDDAKMDQSQD